MLCVNLLSGLASPRGNRGDSSSGWVEFVCASSHSELGPWLQGVSSSCRESLPALPSSLVHTRNAGTSLVVRLEAAGENEH